MPNFSERSNLQELMDFPIEAKEELFLNLRELETINRLTGGPQHGFSAIKKLILESTKQEIHIVDIGFGAGDMLLYLLKNQHQFNTKIKLTGVDIMPETLEYIQKHHSELLNEVDFQICDFNDWFAKNPQVDIISANLFCHHLTDEQFAIFVTLCQKHATVGTVINDLSRAPIAYYGIKILTKLFSKSRFTRNDAPISVLRGFRINELEPFFQKNGIKNFKITWKWAFKIIMVIKP